jgi:hypothetical protein
MNNDILAGDWKQFKGKMLEQWGKITGDELDVIAGRREQIVGKVQEHYGLGRDEAEAQVRTFEERYKAADADLKKMCGHCSTAHSPTAPCPPK